MGRTGTLVSILAARLMTKHSVFEIVYELRRCRHKSLVVETKVKIIIINFLLF